MVFNIGVGNAANLFMGYRPVWNPNGDADSPFFAPSIQPLKTQRTVTTPNPAGYWSGTPVITLHQSAQSLVSAIYDYDVLPVSNDRKEIDIPSGPLSLNDADQKAAMKAAAKFIGLDLVKGDQNFMLVTYERHASTTTGTLGDGYSSQASEDLLTDQALAILNALPPAHEVNNGSVLYDSKLTLADAQKYVEAVGQLGTHFVTSVRTGDKIIQVFAYKDDQFKYLQDQFKAAATQQPDGTEAVSGQLANSWIVYTSPVSSGGFVSEYGSLTSFSRNPQLTEQIKKNKWDDGYTPDGVASIFAASKNYNMLAELTLEVTYACQLTPLSELITNALVQGPWDRLVAGGLLQKYGDDLVIPLRRPRDYDWAKIFPQASDAWVSSIATPVIDIYQERVDLAKVEIKGADIIGQSYPMQQFSCFSQVLQATMDVDAAPMAIPSDNITMIAQIIDTTQAAKTPVLTMSDKGLKNLSVYCDDMYGVLIFQSASENAAKRKTAVDGFVMETPAKTDPVTGRYIVALNSVVSDVPPEPVLIKHSQSVQFSVVAGEALLQSQGNGAKTVKELQVSYLNWLATIIPANTSDEILANARVRALYLTNSIADFGIDAIYVPYVTYDSYSKYVTDLVNQASNLNSDISKYQVQLTTVVSSYKVMDSIDAVNDNVRAIGGVMKDYFKVLADGRGAMDSYYASILDQLDDQLQKTVANVGELQTQLDAQNKLINNLGDPMGIVQQFEKDYAQYQKDEVFKATMSLVSGLFDLGLSFAGIPGEAAGGVLKALIQLKKVYDKLEAVMKVLKQLSSLEKVTDNIDKINNLSNSIQAAATLGNMEMPSLVELEMVPNNVEAALANVPTSGKLNQDKANLIAATKNLVIVGSALLNAQAQASKLLVEISNTKRLQVINSQQQGQMDALFKSLNLNNPKKEPDLAKANLIGATGQLQFQLKQVLSTLARVLQDQNGAIQYTYFGKPAPITSFSLSQLLGVISAQDAAIINAITHLNPQPQPVDEPITVKLASVPYKELINGNFKRVRVSAGDPSFINYVMVRIDRVIPKITGIKTTKSGKYEISLDTQAQPFMDRDPDRQDSTFYSTRRAFGPYVYEAATDKPTFGNKEGTFADKVTHLTPFTDWNVALPAKSTNADIEFDDLFVDIELEFYITAIYNDPAVSLQKCLMRKASHAAAKPNMLMAANSLDASPMMDMGGAAPTMLMASAPPMALKSTTDSRPSLSYLEGQMYQNQAVLNGWDAMFSMLVGPVNAFLNTQFQEYIKKLNPSNESELMTISAGYYGTATPIQFRGQKFWTSMVTKLSIDLSNPLLQFVPSSDQTTVQQYIESGAVTTGSVDVIGGDTTSPFIPGDAYLTDEPLTFTVDTSTNELVIAKKDVLGPNLGSIYLSTTGQLPAPLQPGNPSNNTNEYYIVGWSGTDKETRIKLSADPTGGDAIDLTDNGSGTHTLTLGIMWNTPSEVDTSKNPYVFANVQLAAPRGIVTPPPGQGDKSDTLTVMLDFPTGSFVLRNFHVKPDNWDPSHSSTQISDALANFYTQNEIKYQIQTINLTNLANDEALTPNGFVLHATTTRAGNNILQVLIKTGTDTTLPKSTTIALYEPVAYDPQAPVKDVSNFMVSLIISSQLTFQHIFVDSFNAGSQNFELVAVAPSADYGAWSAKMEKGTVTSEVDFKDHYDVNGTKTQFRITEKSNDLTWDITGLTFKRTQSDGIKLEYSNGTANPPSGGTNVDFQYRQYKYQPPMSQYGRGYWYWTSWKDASAMAYVTLTGYYPLEVFGRGEDQLVKFSTTLPTVEISKSSDLKPTGACECNNNDLKIALLSALASAVPEKLQENMDQVTFQPVSIMALESLLFPADQLVTMSNAVVPSGTLVVGTFLAKVRKESAGNKYNVTVAASAGAKGVFGGTSFQNGTATPMVTVNNVDGNNINISYGPISSANGKVIDYAIDVVGGSVTPAGLIAVVQQPDPENHPEDIYLLLPGYDVTTTS